MFNEGDTTTPLEVDAFPMGSQRINELMPPVMEGLRADATLRERLNGIKFLTTTTGEALISFSYHGQLNASWVDAASSLRDRLLLDASGGADADADADADAGSDAGSDAGTGTSTRSGARVVQLVGRSRRARYVVDGDTLREELRVAGRGRCVYAQTEGAFTQPNARVCEHMLGWAYNVTRGCEESDLCELYCGPPLAYEPGARVAHTRGADAVLR